MVHIKIGEKYIREDKKVIRILRKLPYKWFKKKTYNYYYNVIGEDENKVDSFMQGDNFQEKLIKYKGE